MTYSAEVLADSPLLYWRLGDASGTTATDSSGNGRHGTYGGSPTLGTTGLLTGDSDTAVSFDGVDDAATYSGTILTTASTVTVEAWAKAAAVANQDTLLEVSGTNVSVRWLIGPTAAQTFAIVNPAGSGQATIALPAVISDGVRHHLVITYSDTTDTASVYVDGSLVATGSISGTVTLSEVSLGRRVDTTDPSVVTIDEFAIYRTALSSTRVAAHYTAGTTTGSNEVALTGTVGPVVGTGSMVTSRSVQANGQLPAITGSMQLLGTGRSAYLDATVGPVIGALNLDNSDTAAVRIAAVMPSVVGGLALRSLTVDSEVNRAGAWVRDNIGEAVWEPPVVPPSGAIFPMQQVVAQAYTAPTIDGTHAIITPTYAREDAYRERILIAGRDVSYFRGIPTPPAEYQLVQPFLWGAATIELPQVVLPFEQPGHGDLTWLAKGANVVIQDVDPATDTIVATRHSGVILAFDTSGPLRIEVGGAVTGRASLQDRQMRLIQSRRDAGGLVATAFRSLRGVIHRPVLGTTTGIELIDWGGGGLLDYLNELVSKMTTVDGDKWTVMPDADGIFRTTLLDTVTIHGTVYFDDARVKFDGRSDLTEEPNRVYASGVTPDGMVVKFGAYPGLIQGAASPYPMNDNSAFGIGTTDGDTDTGDGISVMGIRLRVTGYLEARSFYSTYDADMAEGIKDLQRDAGLSVTGTMNVATWRALWELSVTGYDLRGIEILPAAEDANVKPFRRSGSGAIIARNPAYNPKVNPVDRTIAMGAGFTKSQIRRWSRNELTGGEVWRGTIELTTGAIVAGDHTPGTPITSILRSRAIQPGMNLSAPLFAGGIVLHVSGVSVADDLVTLVVSTVPDDTIPTWAAIQRDRDNRNTVHRSFFAQRRSSSFERENTIDEVGGTISPVTLDADNWTVFPVVAKQAGVIEKIRLRLSPSREFVVAAFGRKISPGRLRRVTNAPLTVAGRNRWNEEAVYDALNRDHVVLYVAGSDEDPAGYFPGRKSDDDALTGRHEDDSSFPFVTFANETDRGSVIWVAVWVGAAATVQGGRIMWPSAEEY